MNCATNKVWTNMIQQCAFRDNCLVDKWKIRSFCTKAAFIANASFHL